MAKSVNTVAAEPVSNHFPVVGIGASAGGLEAFRKFVGAIPVQTGMAYIFVQHLDPTHDSKLTEILSKHTSLPVHEITDNIRIAPDQIYIIPANKILIAEDGLLKLSPRPSKEIKSQPINVFFISLALVYQSYAVGVVFSGTGNDGTEGLKSIKENAGITFAQDPESAGFDGMPQSAIEAGVVDFILAPESIPEHLMQMNLHKILLPDEFTDENALAADED
jgi:two-component system, chemotaxis family, CheB/CheR fusion protein